MVKKSPPKGDLIRRLVSLRSSWARRLIGVRGFIAPAE